jgi:hypothetical protein
VFLCIANVPAPDEQIDLVLVLEDGYEREELEQEHISALSCSHDSFYSGDLRQMTHIGEFNNIGDLMSVDTRRASTFADLVGEKLATVGDVYGC